MSNRLSAGNLAHGFLTSKSWETVYGEQYERWRRERWISSDRSTIDFLENLLPLGFAKGEMRLRPHQAEALQRVIFSSENTDLERLLLTLATGTGKSLIIAATIAWLAFKDREIDTFLVLCPNTIVRDRLKRDFTNLSIFKEFKLFPFEGQDLLDTLRSEIISEYKDFQNFLGNQILVANRHQFQLGYKGGNNHLKHILDHRNRIAIFNDEAHNTRGDEYTRTLDLLKDKTVFRLDLTATPDRADNLRPESHEIYSLSVLEAITGQYRENRLFDQSLGFYPKLVKEVIVHRPVVKAVGALTFKDANSDKVMEVREINWEELPRKKNLQLVMDPGGMKGQLTLSVEALKRKREFARGRYKPLLFVIAPSIMGAQQAATMMENEFGLKPLVVVDDESEYDKKELREQAANLGSESSPYDSVVSVYMLREGWDVPEVSVMCLLRGFGSPLFAHQVLGRGLRLIRKGGLESDPSVQELTVIDHPCLDLDYLWDEIDALVVEGDEVVREPEGKGVESDLKEPLAEQTIERKDLYDLLLPLPEPRDLGSVSAERLIEFLEVSLKKIVDYKPEDYLFVEVEFNGKQVFRPRRQVENQDDPRKITAIPDDQVSRDKAQGYFNSELMKWAEEISQSYQPLVTHTPTVYNCLLRAVEKFIFGGRDLTEAPPGSLFLAGQLIPQLREMVHYEMNRRVYSEEILNGE